MDNRKEKCSVKSIIIKVSIVFLVIIGLLTYFSNTIDNYLLPHVTVTFGGEGTLRYNLRTAATIEASDSPDSDALRFRLVCDPSADAFIEVGTTVDIKTLPDPDDEWGEYYMFFRKDAAIITEKTFTDSGIECTAEVVMIDPAEGDVGLSIGEQVIVSGEYESKPYSHILLKSAIQNDSYVYFVIKNEDGKRFVVQTPVTVIAENDFYAAVEMTSEKLPIVLTATKEISDGQRVIVDA